MRAKVESPARHELSVQLSEKPRRGGREERKARGKASSKRPLKGGEGRFWGILCTRFGSQLRVSCGPYHSRTTGREAPRLSGGVIFLRSPSKLVAEPGPTQPSALVELIPVWAHGRGLTGVTEGRIGGWLLRFAEGAGDLTKPLPYLRSGSSGAAASPWTPWA